MNGPYSSAAAAYWNAGWRGVLPLPPRAKKLPPAGYTGEAGVDPSYPDIHAWTESSEGSGNIALRLPRNIIGLDVDNYAGKTGADTLTAAEQRWGSLPETWRTTSRDDGVSGIRLYRIPEGLAWPGELGSATEIIQHRHRYAIVWPSIHPEGRTYRWITPDGVTSAAVPDPDQLPLLPETWVSGLTGGELATSTARNSLTSAQTAQWLVLRPGSGGQPCSRMNRAIEQALRDLRSGSAHCAARDGALRVIRLADEGHTGLAGALTQIRQTFIGEATSPRRDHDGRYRRGIAEADREWSDLVSSGTNLVTANPTGTLTCDCAGQLTGLITGTMPVTDGTSALVAMAAVQPAPAPDQQQDKDRTSWWPRSLTALLAGEDDEPPPDILRRSDGAALFYRGKVNGIIGESESGKTWLAVLAVVQILALGGTATYLDFEDTARGIISRLHAAGAHDLTRFNYIGPEETLHAAASDDLRESLDATHPDLIVLDGFNAAMTLLGLDLGDNGDATKFSQILLRPLSATGSAVVYVDHVPKNKDNRGKGGIGAQAKRAMTTGCAIAVDVLTPFGRGMTGKLGLTVDKDRPGHVRAEAANARHVGTAVLTSDKAAGTVHVVIEAPNTATQSERSDAAQMMVMERVSDWLCTQLEPVSQNKIETAVGGKATDVREAVNRLAAAGHVIISAGSNNRKLALLTHRFTVADALETGPQNECVPVRPECVPDAPQSGTVGASHSPSPRRGGLDGSTRLPPADAPSTDKIVGTHS